MKQPDNTFGVRRLVGALSANSHIAKLQSSDKSEHSTLNRRAFIRAGLLAGLAGLAWLLLRRSCAGSGICNTCPQFAGCGLPWKVTRP